MHKSNFVPKSDKNRYLLQPIDIHLDHLKKNPVATAFYDKIPLT